MLLLYKNSFVFGAYFVNIFTIYIKPKTSFFNNISNINLALIINSSFNL